jgi:acyl-CoA synthetase (AMP-forming)/AMP-acid ligase II/acyl carrier protein
MTRTLEGSIADAIYEHSAINPNRPAYACLTAEGSVQSVLTYRDLLHRSEAVAQELLRTCEPGDRAVLLFHGGSEFIVSFLGCMIAGVIAVPGYPVRVPASSSQPARNFDRLIPILANAEPKVALSTRPVVDRRAELAAADAVFSRPDWIAVEEIPDQRLERRPQRLGSDIAFLQYTSGSTSIPKGVMVSHNNLMSVFRDMHASWPAGDSSVMVSWIPVFHDMGLILGLLFPLYFGFPVYTLMAASVLQQPKRWLEAITNFRATHSAGPNFIFDLCLKRISDADLEDLDLSSLRFCVNGAETVRHTTLQAFHDTFAACGLRPDAMQPGYGLAEFTLKVTSSEGGRIPRAVHLDASACEQHRVLRRQAAADRQPTRTFVSCGWTHAGTDIRIVDPKTCRECRPDEIGEIWVAGENLTHGYWANPQATRAAMQATLADGSGSAGGPYLRTGDLGFVLDRELYVAGRLKDLIIIRGRNLYPQDIEATIEETLPEVRVGRCCAFSVEQDRGEALVVVAELDRVHRNTFHAAQAFARLRQAISLHHEAELFDAVLVRTGTFPLTSSGKVQRHQARKEYLEGRLQTVARMRPVAVPAASAGDVRGWLVGYVSRKLRQGPETLSTGLPFERLGLDSLSLIEMVAELEEFSGQSLAPTVVFDYPTIEELSAHVSKCQGRLRRSAAG